MDVQFEGTTKFPFTRGVYQYKVLANDEHFQIWLMDVETHEQWCVPSCSPCHRALCC